MRPCEKIAVCAFVLFGIMSVWHVNTTQLPVQPCAANCSCTPEDTKWGSAVNVQCGDRNLRSVSSTINNQSVYLLNVSFNVLQTLKEDALLRYESVRYLYLQYCKIDNISEKTFQSLENLTEIDLSNNYLTSISPNLFNGNQKLDRLILRTNDLGSLQWHTPFLNGPSSLSFLVLQSCQLSRISSITFSSLPNLTHLEISRNHLVHLHNDFLSSHQKLKDVNLENNPWQCGVEFEGLMCWMHSKMALSRNRTVKCQHKDRTWDTWSLKNLSSCDSDSTQADTSSHMLSISTSTKPNLTNISLQELEFVTSKTLTNKLSNETKPGIEKLFSVNYWIMAVFILTFLLSAFSSLYAIYKEYSRPRPAHNRELTCLQPQKATEENMCGNTSVSISSSVGGGVNLSQENIVHESELKKPINKKKKSGEDIN